MRVAGEIRASRRRLRRHRKQACPRALLHVDLNAPFLDPNRECRDQFEGWRRERISGADVEPGAVLRAHDPAVLHALSREDAEGVRAHVFDRKVLAVKIEHRDVDIVHLLAAA